MTFLRILTFVSVLLGIAWTMMVLGEFSRDWGPLTAFFFIYPVHLVFGIIAIWQFWRHPERRKLALVLFLLPIVFFFVPIVLWKIAGGPFLTDPKVRAKVLIALFLLALGFTLVRPRTVALLVPRAFFQSKAWNIIVVVGIVISWLPLVIGLLWVMIGGGGFVKFVDGVDRADGWGLLYTLVILALLLGATGLSSMGSFLHAYLGLRGLEQPPHRGLYVTQLVLSVPGVVAMVAIFSRVLANTGTLFG